MNRQIQRRVYGLASAVALLPLLGSRVCAQETPQTANRFCDSIGVNTLISNYHPGMGNAYNTNSDGSVYTAQDFYNKVQLPLAWLGVHHIRDYMTVDDGGLPGDSSDPGWLAVNSSNYSAASDNIEDYYNRLKRLGNQGVKCDLVIQPVGYAFKVTDPSDMVQESSIITTTFLLGCQEAVEGANEWDYFGPNAIAGAPLRDSNNNPITPETRTWHQTFNQNTSQIWSTYRGNSSTAGMQVYSGTIINAQYQNNSNVVLPDTHDYVNGNGSDIPMYGNVSSKVDYGNCHPYCWYRGPGYNDPEENLSGLIGDRQELWGPVAPATPVPFVITETGYYTGTPDTSRANWLPVSYTVQEKYTLRTLLTAFNLGAYRTYLFQLYDHLNNPADMDSNFGLIKYDGTNKPSYNALESLIGLLSDASTSTAVTPLTWSLGGNTANVNHTLLQKSDGSYYLALWLGKASDDSTISQAVTVTVPSTIAAGSLYTINQYGSMSSSPVTITNGQMSFNVTDSVSVLKLTGPIVESTPLALSQTSVSNNGGTVTATVTFQNVSATAMTFLPYIAARDGSGNNVDFGSGSDNGNNNSSNSNITLQPGQTVSVSATKTLATYMNTGTWSVFGSYRTSSNAWYNLSPTLPLTVTN